MVSMYGPIVRKRKNQKVYEKYAARRTSTCEFCEFSEKLEHFREEYGHYWVVANLFGYDIWDGVNVREHLLVSPRRHVDSIAHFTPEEQKQYMQILADYESRGYSIYSRAPQDITKSISHQHTHLIKLGRKRAKALVYVAKPHVLKYY